MFWQLAKLRADCLDEKLCHIIHISFHTENIYNIGNLAKWITAETGLLNEESLVRNGLWDTKTLSRKIFEIVRHGNLLWMQISKYLWVFTEPNIHQYLLHLQQIIVKYTSSTAPVKKKVKTEKCYCEFIIQSRILAWKRRGVKFAV